ncbi:hypothetical protein CERSUDRAFT_82056 [Gelatoporia subvermispora B]|uniref:Uncharacterized protein n=1 Tax=Ceriporiopsis subvermispora (strain B) TaxID=914234 RepID=M2RKH0_CERS8|nr:hypothetical protein CERSUDRAFT_82056 [Gelatoporia subvermispora B]
MPHPSSDEILSHSITMLAAFKEACTAISIVPALPAVVGALLEILKTIENVKKDKEVCTKLRNRVIELGHELKEDFDKFRYVIDPSLDLQLVKMLLTLKTVQEDLEKLSNLRRVSRWIHQGTIKTKLEGHIETVDQMGHTYLRTIVSALATNALRQVTYTQDQHRYFRECELEWREKRHVVGQSIDNIFSEELIALWNGRAVVVRYLCEDHSTEDEVNNLITSFPSYRSPHMAQFLGRSHPGTKQAFIVLETGHIDLGRYLRTPGSVFDKLRCVFQMVQLKRPHMIDACHLTLLY